VFVLFEDHEGVVKFVKILLANTKVSPFKLFTTAAPSQYKPFSKPVAIELKTEVAVFLLKRNARSCFSPTGRVTVPFPFAPTKVILEKIGLVLGWPVEPAASLSDSKPFESPIASDRSLSRMINPN
jgi:hypothetical protein